MNSELRFHPDAPGDLAAAINWYDQISAGLGNRFRLKVQDAFRHIESRPLLHGLLFQDVRGLRVQGFPYLVQFRMIDNTPVVLGVFHTASNPELWRERAR